MNDLDDKHRTSLIELTSDIVAAYVSNNALPTADISATISDVFAVLTRLRTNVPAPQVATTLMPPVPIKKTIKHDFLVSLEDGKRYKTLKQHLSRFGLTPETYRKKWGLPADYPMVAPAYSEGRSDLAKRLGLGLKASAITSAAPKPKRTARRKEVA